ncbi:enoyl-CoA hydratase [Phenylobacterium sp.]|jgi:enoyl-CoA hydratase/carnithine racemase|uniref:enoyl-CoA hydratase n=1 Tax=Phenylobacterium sp. TaxID=1871053 RepID=UPI002E34E5BB|nr:enoyl-CoA hydratase [Phenylobacterium sp.]HEX3364157.1 enoyl-CoA hydratase [Phenylobacterium sp.]
MQILTTLEDSVLRLQINRPEKKNALTLGMYEQMTSALEDAGRDPKVRVVLIHGHADDFTSGNDLQDFVHAPPVGEDSPVGRFITAISHAEKPIVAAVSGAAVGIGTTMLLHCDFVYAAKDTRFQLPFVNLALLPEAGSSLLLPMQIGYLRAAELLMLGEPFSAAKALQYGLVTEVCPDGPAALSAAQFSAGLLSAKPAAALHLIKTLLKSPYAGQLAAQVGDETRHFVERLRSPEAAEAFRAFSEKRAPDFTQFA